MLPPHGDWVIEAIEVRDSDADDAFSDYFYMLISVYILSKCLHISPYNIQETMSLNSYLFSYKWLQNVNVCTGTYAITEVIARLSQRHKNKALVMSFTTRGRLCSST